MGPSPLQIILVIVIALALFGAGRIADLWETVRSRRQQPSAPRRSHPPARNESEGS
jgi:hypothetical protein